MLWPNMTDGGKASSRMTSPTGSAKVLKVAVGSFTALSGHVLAGQLQLFGDEMQSAIRAVASLCDHSQSRARRQAAAGRRQYARDGAMPYGASLLF